MARRRRWAMLATVVAQLAALPLAVSSAEDAAAAPRADVANPEFTPENAETAEDREAGLRASDEPASTDGDDVDGLQPSATEDPTEAAAEDDATTVPDGQADGRARGSRDAAREARATGRPVEVEDEAGPQIEVNVNPDGSRSARVYPGPQRFPDDDGHGYQNVDAGVSRRPDGRFTPENAPGRPAFAGRAHQEMVTIETDAGTMVVRVPGARDVAGEVGEDGTTVVYPDAAAAGGDLEVGPTATGFESSLVIESAAEGTAGLTEEFEVPPGVTARQGEAGVEFVARGEVVAIYGGGVAYDSVPIHTRNVPVETTLVSQRGRRVTVQSSVPAEWLTDPDRAWPATIDPNFYLNTSNISPTLPQEAWDTFVASGQYANYNTDDQYAPWYSSAHWNRMPNLYAGASAYTPNTVYRSFLYFPLILPDGGKITEPGRRYVTDANLALFSWWSYTTAWSTMQLWQPGNPAPTIWSTWNSRPNPDGYQLTNGGSPVQQSSYGPGMNAGCCPAGGWHYFPMRDAANNWLNEWTPNNGILLRLSNETDTNLLRLFYSGQNAQGGNVSAPALTINYLVPPSEAQSVSASMANDGSASVSWVTPADSGGELQGWVAQAVQSSTGSVVATTSGCCGTSTTFTGLNPNDSYYFQVQYSNRAGSGPFGRSNTVVPASACDRLTNATLCVDQLGLESWWRFVTRDVGPASTASVNVGTGNLVLRQDDTTPVQGYGRLALNLRRTYNSQAPASFGSLSPIGEGWTLNVSGVGMDPAGSLGVGLAVDPNSTIANPLAVTLFDRDGTRHVYNPTGVTATSGVYGVLAGAGGLDQLAPRVLRAANGRNVCIDQTFSPPRGVFLNVWRYLAVQPGTSPCTAASGSSPVVLGYAAVRPDRTRMEFDILGRLVALADPSGNTIAYTYDGLSSSSRLTMVHERTAPGCETLAVTDTANPCRAIRFTYGTNTVTATDPAGRRTTYTTTVQGSTRRLTGVSYTDSANAALGNWTYTYQGLNGASCGARTGQLCSVTAPNGTRTTFGYAANGTGAAYPAVASITERDDLTGQPDNTAAATTSISYTSTSATAVRDGRQWAYTGIDNRDRPATITEGPPGGPALRSTTLTWDSDSLACQQPSAQPNNHLCTVTRRSLDDGNTNPAVPAVADDVVQYRYGNEGQVLREARRLLGSEYLITTTGYRVQYIVPGQPVRVALDQVAGNGNVSSQARTIDRPLFYVVDRTETLTPRGNAAGSEPAAWQPYRTMWDLDDNDAVVPTGALPAADYPCGQRNTGVTCSMTEPEGAVTSYAYNRFGQRTEMRTPNIGTANTPFRYTYYSPGARDLSNLSSSAGWLQAVTDPYGRFVVFGYDRAANVARSWDRNATARNGTALSTYPGTNGGYSETRYRSFANPWRYVTAEVDQLGNTTTYGVDAHGNRLTITPPRGNQAANSSYDIVQVFNARDQLVSTVLPEQNPAGTTSDRPTSYRYDANGNQIRVTDPNGRIRLTDYDAANRPVATRWSRGTTTGCRTATSAEVTVFGSGTTICETRITYNGLDQEVATTDAAGSSTFVGYDGAGRRTITHTPRDATGSTTVEVRYDADGNVVDECPARQLTEGGGCVESPRYGSHHTYDRQGRRIGTTRYRQTSEGSSEFVPLVTEFVYDGNDNLTIQRDPRHTPEDPVETIWAYDLLDRRTTQTVPRAPGTGTATIANTTTWAYDPAGNVTAVTAPDGGVTAYRYDNANRLTLTVAASDNADAGAAGATNQSGDPVVRNVRTGQLYDADSNVVARYDGRAYLASSADPDERFMTRVDFDRNGRPIALWQPFWDTNAASVPGGGPSEAADCPAVETPRHTPSTVTGVPNFPAGVGVCVIRVSYDAAGNLATLRNPTAGALLAAPTTTNPDNADDPANPQWYRNANRYEQRTYTHDNLLAEVTVANPAATTNPSHPAEAGLPAGRVRAARFTHDALGRVTQTIDAADWQTNTTWTADGLLASEEGRPTGATAYEERTEVTYNANGQTTSVRGYLDPTTTRDWSTEYYSDGTVAAYLDPAGNRTTYRYDLAGNAVQVWSPTANDPAPDDNNAGVPVVNTYTYDNLLASTFEPLAPDGTLRRRTLFDYDPTGRKTTQGASETDCPAAVDTTGCTPRAGRDDGALGYTWNTNGWLRTETSRPAAGGGTITHRYNPDGTEAGNTDTTSGITIDNTYDLTGWLRTQTTTGGPGTPTPYTSALRYDADGLERTRGTLDNGTFTTAETFTNNDGRAVTTIDATGTGSPTGDWTIAYDRAGRPDTGSDPTGRNLNWTFNPDGTIQNLAITAGTTTMASWTYAYDSLNRQRTQTFTGRAGTADPLGLIPAGALDDRTYGYSYDDAGRVTAFTQTGGSRPDDTTTYSWDRNGNRRTVTNGADVTTFNYRADNSINTIQSPAGTRTYGYEPFGGVTNDSCSTMTHDGFDRLGSVQTIVSVACGQTQATAKTYAYDGLNRQAAATGTTETTTLRYVAGTTTLASETPSAGATGPRRYLTSPLGTHAVITTSEVQYLHDDGTTNIGFIGAPDPGQTRCDIRYDPWDNPQDVDGAAANPCDTGTTTSTVLAQGSRRDPDTRNYQYGSRTYDPSTATWLQPDNSRGAGAPTDQSIGTDPLLSNRYSYVNGDPVNLADPSGHQACSTTRNAPDGGCGYGLYRRTQAAGGTRRGSSAEAAARLRARSERTMAAQSRIWLTSKEDGSVTASGGVPIFLPGRDPIVDNYFRNAYRSTSRLPGGTAGALEYELRNGVRYLSRAGHYESTVNSISHLQRALAREVLHPFNRAALQAEIEDLVRARDAFEAEAASRGVSPQQLIRSFPHQTQPVPRPTPPSPPPASPPGAGPPRPSGPPPAAPPGGGSFVNPLFLIPFPPNMFSCEAPYLQSTETCQSHAEEQFA